MQVARSLHRSLKGRAAAIAVLGAMQLVQPAGVAAQNNDLANEAIKVINDVRSRVPNCDLLSAQNGMVRTGATPVASQVPQRPQLAWNPRLADAAIRHSQAMATRSFFDHVDHQGKSVGQRATDSGYKFRVVSENIAAGQDNLGEAMMEWIASRGHCENLLDPRVTEFGLARVDSPNPADPYTSYWTLVMGTPRQ